ncbi:unnamed protein product [Rotaria magnacalcarata]|uniref:Uncharacterized protein n=1 Tax=Rotaria magnacalcarata TaxID=392030 RepID=A0A816PMK7_9BILA|nr:unnamed protein product [Rotaria magnacalcarata]CAF2049718.1 unnamed protein product [Rotaria magnacalcarata]CAF3786668.1 unnamed protein product [Rotaria magnacalcarata]CAF4037508.1 unnamed protein product [Rotaria magnacalcarata]CAF4054180.1 unnamed protein product [Rotaria magnacalcarata]
MCLTYTKEKELVYSFSRRPAEFDLQTLIDQHDASVMVRYLVFDFWFDYGTEAKRNKIIRLFDETVETAADFDALLNYKRPSK